jgi:hypothetical protein
MLTSLRFLFCAIPGLFLFLAGLAMLALSFDPSSHHRLAFGAGGGAAIAAGVPLILYGTGRWRKWGYLLPFLSLPVVLFASSEVKGAWLLLAVPFVVGAGVHAYYRRQSARHPSS